jgi:hypothetical protein
MTPASIFLMFLGIYLAIGSVIGVAFVLNGIRKIDPVANGAPLRVRILFLPGAISIWPIVLHLWRTKLKAGSSS